MRLLWFWLFFAAFSAALSVSLSAPADGSYSSVSTVVFSFSADSNVSSCALYTNASGWTAVANNSNASSFSYPVNPDAALSWSVACSDGNQTVFAPGNRTVRLDTATPSVPGNLSATGHTPAILTWTASSDASPLTYQISRNGTSVANVTTLTFSENVPASTTHNYSVRAVDPAGWASVFASLLVNGPASSVVISNLVIVPTSSTATVSWTATPAANASLTYGIGATWLTVSSASVSTTANLPLAGLSAATTYSYNATACAATCTAVSGTFRTLPSSYPSPSQIQFNSSAAGSFARFSAYWTDSLNLSHYVFSTNASGTWANATYTFNGSYSNHSFTLPSTALTVSWLFYANNSQNGLNQTPVQNFTVVVSAVATPTSTPTPTPVPTATPVPSATPVPTAAPAVPSTVPTPTPAAAPTPEPVAGAAAAMTFSNWSGQMTDLVLDAQEAEFALSPTGLVIGVSERQAKIMLYSNFSNTGQNVTVRLRAVIVSTKLNSSGSELELVSEPTFVANNQTLLLQTRSASVPPGDYDVIGQVLAADSGQVLDSRILKMHVASSYTGRVVDQSSPALTGILVVFLVIGAIVAGQLNAVKKEFA